MGHRRERRRWGNRMIKGEHSLLHYISDQRQLEFPAVLPHSKMLPRIGASASRWTLGCVMAEGDRTLIGWSNNKAATCDTVIDSTLSHRLFGVTFRVRQRLAFGSANDESTRQGILNVANHTRQRKPQIGLGKRRRHLRRSESGT